MKKYLTYITLGLVAVVTVMALLGLFGVPVFLGAGLKVLLSLVTLTVVGILLLNTIELIEKKNIIAYVSAGLIILSAILFLAIIWGGIGIVTTFGKLTVCVSMISVVFNIIVGNVLKLGKKYLVLQLIEYLLLTVLVVLISIGVFSADLGFLGEIYFWAIVIVAFAMGIALSVFAKKVVNDRLVSNTVKEGYVQVKKEEYDALVQENAALKQKIAELEANK